MDYIGVGEVFFAICNNPMLTIPGSPVFLRHRHAGGGFFPKVWALDMGEVDGRMFCWHALAMLIRLGFP